MGRGWAGRVRALEPAARSVAAATWAGALLGALVGGVGGRLAMRLLMLTSSDALRGVDTDDGFPIGRFTLSGTLTLLALSTIVGVVGGLAYLVIRRWLIGGAAFRSATCALGAGLVVGSMLVHADGIDFTLLAPRWLAVSLFVAIPALFGALVVPLVERFDRDGSWFRTRPLKLAAAPLVVWAFPLLFVFVALPALAVAALVWLTPARRALESRAATAGGRVALAAAGAVGAVTLVSDVAAIV
jgi:hypothetical protein